MNASAFLLFVYFVPFVVLRGPPPMAEVDFPIAVVSAHAARCGPPVRPAARLPVSERTDQLFGEEGAQAVADRLEAPASKSGNVQLSLFPEL
jgi:hypothetical protein